MPEPVNPENPSPIKFSGKLTPEASRPFARNITEAYVTRVQDSVKAGTQPTEEELTAWSTLMKVVDPDALDQASKLSLNQTIEGLDALVEKYRRNIPQN